MAATSIFSSAPTVATKPLVTSASPAISAGIQAANPLATAPRVPTTGAPQAPASIFPTGVNAGTVTNALAPKPAAPAPGVPTGIQSAASGVPAATQAPQSADSFTPGALMRSQYNQAAPQMQSNAALGANIQGQGAAIANQQQGQANAYNAAGQGFNATATNAAPALSHAPQAAAVGNVNPNSLGAISQVAGQLGGGYQVGNVGGIAGQLGAAPQVGGVGNIQMAGGPGAVMPQLGSQGAQNAAQGEMLSRLSGFLDSPEGPSVAEAQLKQAQAGNMADLIGAARSGRGGPGAQALALQDAMSAGAGIASDTAGQLATLRAQEADMQRNRQLSAIGLGGQMSEAQRAGDLSFRGQDLAALQGDQSTALGSRGQDLQAAMANQGTQTALEQLRAQTALGARGQNLSALQGDQGTALGLEGLRAQTATTTRAQDLGALTADQQASIAGRGQNLSALQGNQSTGAQMSLGQLQANLGARGQDASMLQTDADRQLAAQRLNLDAGLGYGNLANTASGQGLQFLNNANQQGVATQGMNNDLLQNQLSNQTSLQNALTAGEYGLQAAAAAAPKERSFLEQLALNTVGGAAQGAGSGLVALSDERAKTDISPLDAIAEHLRAAPGYSYRYKPGFGEDPDVEHAGPMAQDLERGPFGKALVKRGADGLRRVDTSRLALVNHAALASMRSELDRLKAALEA